MEEPVEVVLVKFTFTGVLQNSKTSEDPQMKHPWISASEVGLGRGKRR
jgi:hypothetical protein